MTDKIKRYPVIIAQSLCDDIGGPAKTIKFFKNALDAKTYSFNNLNKNNISPYVDIVIDKRGCIYSFRGLLRLCWDIHQKASVVSLHSIYGFHFLFSGKKHSTLYL